MDASQCYFFCHHEQFCKECLSTTICVPREHVCRTSLTRGMSGPLCTPTGGVRIVLQGDRSAFTLSPGGNAGGFPRTLTHGLPPNTARAFKTGTRNPQSAVCPDLTCGYGDCDRRMSPWSPHRGRDWGGRRPSRGRPRAPARAAALLRDALDGSWAPWKRSCGVDGPGPDSRRTCGPWDRTRGPQRPSLFATERFSVAWLCQDLLVRPLGSRSVWLP